MNKTTISGCIITFNEQRKIGRAIISLMQFCDEIVVVDAGSKDRTVEIAKKLGAKVFYRKWDNDFGAQRNFAIEESVGDWIFMLDSDEVVSPGLAKEIPQLISQTDFDGFALPRKNYINYHIVKSKYRIEPQTRLFKRKAFYVAKIHEKPVGLDRIFDCAAVNHYIYHYKSAKEQQRHLIFQKDLMENGLITAKKDHNLKEIERLEKNLKNWKIWWKDTII